MEKFDIFAATLGNIEAAEKCRDEGCSAAGYDDAKAAFTPETLRKMAGPGAAALCEWASSVLDTPRDQLAVFDEMRQRTHPAPRRPCFDSESGSNQSIDCFRCENRVHSAQWHLSRLLSVLPSGVRTMPIQTITAAYRSLQGPLAAPPRPRTARAGCSSRCWAWRSGACASSSPPPVRRARARRSSAQPSTAPLSPATHEGGRKRVLDTLLLTMLKHSVAALLHALRGAKPLLLALVGVKTLSGALFGPAFHEKSYKELRG